MFTVDAVIAEEERIFAMVDVADARARLGCAPRGPRGPIGRTRRAPSPTSRTRRIWCSRCKLRPARAKRTRCKRCAPPRTAPVKKSWCSRPPGKAVDEAMRDEAGDRGLTVTKALQLIENGQLQPGPAHRDGRRRSLHGRHPRAEATARGHHRRSRQSCSGRGRLPAGAGQGSRRHVRGALRGPALVAAPQRGMADARPRRTRRLARRCGPRAATGYAKPSAGTATTTGCTPAMRSPWPPTPPPPTSKPAPTAKTSQSSATHWEIADAINQRLHDHYTNPDAPSVRVARDQHVRAGDLIMSRRNDATLTVQPGSSPAPRRTGRPGPQRQPLARDRGRHHTPPHRRRAAHRLRPRHLRGRLPARAHHPGLREHRALRPRHDRRQLQPTRHLLDDPVAIAPAVRWPTSA